MPENEAFAAILRGIERMELKLDNLDKRVQALEKNEAACQAVQDGDMRQMSARLDTLTLQVADAIAERKAQFVRMDAGIKRVDDDVRTRLTEIEPWVKGLRWALLIIGGFVLALLWRVFIGDVSIIGVMK